MAQASSSRSRYQFSQFSQAFQRWALQWLSLPAIQPLLRCGAASRRWLVSGTALVVLLLWNWRLVVALGLGSIALAAGYLLQQGQGKRLWALGQYWWQNVDRPFALTIASSLGVTGMTYLTLTIWRELHSSWLAIGFLLQGAMVLAVLGLLAWQIWRSQDGGAAEAAIDSTWLNALSDTDPLQRLLAVRQLTHAAFQNSSALMLTRQELAESFRLMLNRETEPLLCRALLESLQMLDARPPRETMQSAAASQSPALQASPQPTVQVTVRRMEPAERNAQ